MPMKLKDYDPTWPEFSLRIRRDRAEWHCECSGECGRHEGRCERKQGDDTGNPNYKATLTVAHLDHEGGVCRCKVETGIKCVREDHCIAACNGCHLMIDLPHHMEKSRRTRIEKKDAARSLLVA
jgi:hypothetical protein